MTAALVHRAQRAARAPRRFQVVGPGECPPDALSWNSPSAKGHARRAWRNAIIRKFGSHSRILQLAWVLADLCSGKGYAYPSDGWLGKVTGLREEAVQRGLKDLVDGDAIIRVHVTNGRTFQRRIFLAATIVERERTRRGDGGATPVTTTGEVPVMVTVQRRQESRGPSVRDAARAAAERRLARERGEPPRSFLDDD